MINFVIYSFTHNAALRGAGTHYKSYRTATKSLNPTQTTNATRCESVLKRLLCLSFKGLRFTKTKINSALTHKQKPRPKKLK
ncbi:hypothetical protein CRN42_11955 [Vibrio vulnificus]|nr:hypothetical protein CRN42_11955 [Vibrio vulnificus]